MHEKIVIVGRPNVGKSTLFNRLIGKRRALEHPEPGTTRDSTEALVCWKDKTFILSDTAGWTEDSSVLSLAIKKMVEKAIAPADFIILVVDAKEGLHAVDSELAKILRKSSKKILLVVNKMDSPKDQPKMNEFYRLGIDDIIAISADHGLNITDLMEDLYKKLSGSRPGDESAHAGRPVRVIFVGKPNVGKSSLLNSLLKQERCIVHDMPGTTREAVDVTLSHGGQDYIFIDTPGLHRGRAFKNDLDYLSALSTDRAIERADVAIMVIDAVQGIGETEAKVADLILRKGRSCLLAVNKWDLIEEKEQALKFIRDSLEEKLPFLWWAKLLLVSAKTGLRVEKIPSEAQIVFKEFAKQVPETELRDAILHAADRKRLSRHGEPLKIVKVEQVGICPPTFIFTVNDPELVHFSAKRYLENSLRATFGFEGTPLILKFRRKPKSQ
jgi:GTPase